MARRGVVKNTSKLFVIALLLSFVGVGFLSSTKSAHAAAGVNQQMNFQGRLFNAQGAVVPDGYYNIQFKIYQDGDGQTAGNPTGTLMWTESHLNANSQGIEVKNGFMSVQLGSVTAFGSSVDWNQDTLWLSMNIAGTGAACTPFTSCSPDGEMVPMKRLSSSPYAINSGQLGGLTSAQFIQLAQGVQTDASTASSIFVNKTGSGNILQLQSGGNDAFLITNTGDAQFGANSNHTLSVATAGASVAGKSLTLSGGSAGTGGSALSGGDLVLQGGSGGGTNGNGGNLRLDAGVRNGAGADGAIQIGTVAASTIQIGNTTLSSGTQTINIGNNNTSGGTTDVTVGAGGSAAGGSTTVQAKSAINLAVDGVTRATLDNSDTLYLGNGVTAATPNDFTVQGTGSTTTGVAGGGITIQGGNATVGNANGGNVTITGGTGIGTGARGLVVIDTPSFTTAATQICNGTPAPCVIDQANVDNNGVVSVSVVGVTDLTVELPDPTNTTPGRILYVTAENGISEDFTLSVNGGGTGHEIAMRQSTSATMVWNGSDWTAAGASSSTTLQAAYDNTLTSAGGAEILLSGPGGSADGFTIRNNATNPISGGILEVQSSIGTNLFSVNSLGAELAANGGAETQGADASSFPANTWGAAPAGGAVTRTTTSGQFVTGQAGVQVSASGTNQGVRNNLSGNPVPDTTYTVSFAVKASVAIGSNNLNVQYSRDGGLDLEPCTAYSSQNVADDEWTKITCTITTDLTTATDPDLIIRQADVTSRNIWIDNLSFMRNDDTTDPSHVQIGGGVTGGQTTLFTLDRSSAPPVDANNETYLGSMYYDSLTGRIQCYESDGWGACGSAPDEIITLTPEYPGAVLNGPGIGTMTADFCSNELGVLEVNTGFCDEHLSRQYYRWTSPQASPQTYSIYVSYKLPSTFKEFSDSDTIKLTALTDNTTNGSVSYEVFRSSGSIVSSCGSATTVTTPSADTWYTVPFGGNETLCNFAAGDYIIFKVNATAQGNANVYVENLEFTYLNQ